MTTTNQITNGHVTNNNNNSSIDGDGKISFVGRCQGALIGAMERGFYRFGFMVAK